MTNEGDGDGGLEESCINRAGEWEGTVGAKGDGGQTEERRYGEDKARMSLPHEGVKVGEQLDILRES